MIKLIIAGGRDFSNYNFVEEKFIGLYKKHIPDICIISGMAPGADSLGIDISENFSLKLIDFPAKWELYGNGAGLMRNIQMAKEATHLLAFWDGKSTGTKHMIKTAKQYQLKINVYNY